MAIIIRLSGGLGNQMYQYALGRQLSVNNNTSLWLSKSFYTPSKHRSYRLDNFNIKARLLPDRVGAWLDKAYLKPDQSTVCWHVPIFREHGALGFHPEVFECPKTAYFGGHWQSYKYFENLEGEIAREFQISKPMAEDRMALADQIRRRVTVSVHIRRGDYLQANTAHIGALPAAWYRDAMARMAESLIEPQFAIFSEDIAWAHENLPSGYDKLIIAPHPHGCEFEDMHLMALCDHHIIANSTFSWWGAWLNPSKTKQVIAPRQWFAGAPSDIEDRIPPSWILL